MLSTIVFDEVSHPAMATEGQGPRKGNLSAVVNASTMGCGFVCTAAMVYGFGIIKELTSGLSDWMDGKGYATLDDLVGRAVTQAFEDMPIVRKRVDDAEIDCALSNSFGFGGHNGCLVVGSV